MFPKQPDRTFSISVLGGQSEDGELCAHTFVTRLIDCLSVRLPPDGADSVRLIVVLPLRPGASLGAVDGIQAACKSGLPAWLSVVPSVWAYRGHQFGEMTWPSGTARQTEAPEDVLRRVTRGSHSAPLHAVVMLACIPPAEVIWCATMIKRYQDHSRIAVPARVFMIYSASCPAPGSISPRVVFEDLVPECPVRLFNDPDVAARTLAELLLPSKLP